MEKHNFLYFPKNVNASSYILLCTYRRGLWDTCWTETISNCLKSSCLLPMFQSKQHKFDLLQVQGIWGKFDVEKAKQNFYILLYHSKGCEYSN